MRETAATTGARAEAGAETAEDLDVSDEASAHGPDTEPARPDGMADTEDTDREAGEAAAAQDDADADAPDPDGDGDGAIGRSGSPHYVRAPGMPPPPDHWDEDTTAQLDPTVRVPVGVGLPRREPITDRVDLGTLPTTAPISGAPTGDPGAPADGMAPPHLEPTTAVGSARVHEAVRATRAAAGPRGPRRARLTVRRFDPWSVMKFSFTVSLVLFIVMIVAASVLYLALDAMGVFASVNNTLAELIESGGGEGEGFRITAQNVIGTAGALGAINVVLFTALATLGAFIYNVCSDLVGGVEVTLAERD